MKRESTIASRAMWGDKFQASAYGINSDEIKEKEKEEEAAGRSSITCASQLMPHRDDDPASSRRR